MQGLTAANKKKTLTAFIRIMLLIGLGLLAYPFVASLMQSDKAAGESTRFDIASMAPGSYRLLPLPRRKKLYGEYGQAMLLLKQANGKLHAWTVLVHQGAVGMPDKYWWQPVYDCQHFGPSLINGRIDESKPLECHDSNATVANRKQDWQWTIDGKALSATMTDMIPTRGAVEGEYFVLQGDN